MNRTFKKNLHIEIAYIKYIYAGFEFIFYTQEKFAQSKHLVLHNETYNKYFANNNQIRVQMSSNPA